MIKIATCASFVLLSLAQLRCAQSTRSPASAAPTTTAPTSAAATQLHDLFAREWERSLRESPETASTNGDLRFNDQWTDQSIEAITRRHQSDRAALQDLRLVDRSQLSVADKLNYDTFAWQLETTIERYAFRSYLQPVGHQGGVQTLDGLSETLRFSTTQDYRDWLKRLEKVPEVLKQVTTLLQEGVAQGNVPPRVLMDRVPAQLSAQTVDDPTKSPFYRPFKNFPASIPEADRAEFIGEAKRLITAQIVPAYGTFATFFSETYLPHTGSSIALSERPNGAAYYAFLARYYTTTELSVTEIHEIGLREVARIRTEMEAVKAKTEFKGSLAEFFEFLRSDSQFYEPSPEALLTRYRATAKRIDPELVKVFYHLPRQPYGVRPIPDNIAPDTTTAYYQPGAIDGSRAGTYYVNLFRPEVRPTWEMIPLSLHEAVPGHHFQFASSLELEGAPNFRRTAYFVAYSEGWALYAEQLGFEMGLYNDPYDHFGQLTYEMWRAVRLVIDTGMHAMGWSRGRAITYFKDNAPKTDQDIVNEVDRYIGTPGQALAYKIGQLRISELRQKAETALGTKFDVRAFNDAVLATGSVPLDALSRHIEAWIDAHQ